jgi:type IV pilus assembly protein PilF
MIEHKLAAVSLGICLTGCISMRGAEQSAKHATADIYVKKGVTYMENGMLDVALQDLQHAIDLDPRNSEAHNAIAVLYERLDQPQAARAHYRRAIELAPDNASAENNYGRLLCAQGEYAEAMKHFQKIMASRLYQTPWLALTNMGHCAYLDGKKQEAEQYLRKALELEPKFPPALLQMCRLSLENRQYLSARAFLQRYQEVAEDTPETLWAGIQIEHALGNRPAVVNYIEKLRGQFAEAKETALARKQFPGY